MTLEFRRIDAEMNAGLATLDSDIATLTNASFTKFMQLQAKNAHTLLGVYTESIDLISPGAGGASAASPPSKAAAAVENAAVE